jgi:hypothetical protein
MTSKARCAASCYSIAASLPARNAQAAFCEILCGLFCVLPFRRSVVPNLKRL